MPKGTIDDLRKVIALGGLSDEHLQWILDRCEYHEYDDGDIIFKYGEEATEMILMTEGKVIFYLKVNDKLVYYFTFENDRLTGGAGGVLPYSRMKTFPGDSFASGKVRTYNLHKKYFPDLEKINPDLIQSLIGYMTERARHFATQKLQYEKVNALGQLAAGIAHELNNPAAAINRIASDLIKRLMQNYDLTELLLTKKIAPEIIRDIRQIIENKKTEGKKARLSPLQRMDKEDEIFDWLEQSGIAKDRQAAETLAETEFTIEELEHIRTTTGSDSFADLLPWLENVLSSQRIIKDLDDASCRISNLVGAIKSHVHMDRTNEMQNTNVHVDIENTLTLLGYKLREKNITVTKKFCTDLRDVPAYIGELNQVWTNLIDNAIFAMKNNGELTIETRCNEKEVNVHIIDNGGGIPPEIVSRIFDPFFTTKKVGEGTGIGLDLVTRIVKRHNGDVKVNSSPGRTEFVVCIPIKDAVQKTPNESIL